MAKDIEMAPVHLENFSIVHNNKNIETIWS